jgi:glyoxylase-like metal-dependent hydrolase (beta-lactamase superfamily II)
MSSRPSSLSFPFAEPPAFGETVEIAPGLLWARIPLPFRLDHVNIYLIEDQGGWAIFDTGIADDVTREAWTKLLAGRRVTRVIVSHFHPDHIGLAGWLCARHDAPLLTSQTTYLGCINISLRPDNDAADHYRAFYVGNGLPDDVTAQVTTRGHSYLRMVTDLPPTFARIVAGDDLVIGGRTFRAMSGEGHAPEQIMLWCAEEKLFLAADEVLEKITPNISVWAIDPTADPLGLFYRSLRQLKTDLPEDALALAGHRLPFVGVHRRCDELIAHHEERCGMIAAACRERPQSVSDLLPVVFPRVADPHQLGFAFSEVFAHVNRMLRDGRLIWADRSAGVARVAAA